MRNRRPESGAEGRGKMMVASSDGLSLATSRMTICTFSSRCHRISRATHCATAPRERRAVVDRWHHTRNHRNPQRRSYARVCRGDVRRGRNGGDHDRRASRAVCRGRCAFRSSGSMRAQSNFGLAAKKSGKYARKAGAGNRARSFFRGGLRPPQVRMQVQKCCASSFIIRLATVSSCLVLTALRQRGARSAYSVCRPYRHSEMVCQSVNRSRRAASQLRAAHPVVGSLRPQNGPPRGTITR
ncbi:hypothetical protein OKW43_000812 [Paraburkholderia sp. WC7.3g]